VAELRGDPDEPDRDDRPGQHALQAGGDSGAVRTHVEPRSRAEYAADLEQRTVSGWDDSGSPGWRDPASPGWRDPASSGCDDSGARAANEAGDRAGGRDAPLEAVRRFEPGRAGLPDISAPDAAPYIDARRDGRPWLAAASGCAPEVQRVFAAVDQGGGHGHSGMRAG
jgi:hypothetical protein